MDYDQPQVSGLDTRRRTFVLDTINACIIVHLNSILLPLSSSTFAYGLWGNGTHASPIEAYALLGNQQ